VGSLFFQLGHGVNDARSCFGAAFMAVLFMAMGSMPQIGVVMAQKAVWLKHRDSLLYPGYAHGVVSEMRMGVFSNAWPARPCGSVCVLHYAHHRPWRWGSCPCLS
jgi:hypothetical protein